MQTNSLDGFHRIGASRMSISRVRERAHLDAHVDGGDDQVGRALRDGQNRRPAAYCAIHERTTISQGDRPIHGAGNQTIVGR